MRLNVCFNEMGHFQLLSRAVSTYTVVVGMEISPQEEMANPRGMKVFTVERHGLPEEFVSFRAICGVQSSPLVFAPNLAIVWGPPQLQAPGETLCFRFAFP